jgi:regulatory protein
VRSLDEVGQVLGGGEVMAFAKAKKKTPLTEAALFEYAVGVLARKMRTVRDLKRLMRTRAEEGDVSERAMDAVCARLKELGYLSDKRFAADYTRLRKENEKFGRRRVQQDLMQKGVHKELIATTLAKAYEEVDEAALAREYIARKRMKKPAGADAATIQKETARVMGRLARAGFSSGAIYKVLREWELPEEAMPVEGGADSDSYAERDEELPEF